MGSIGSVPKVKIQINLDRPDRFYFAGDVLSGTVDVAVSNGQPTVDEIDLLVTGEVSLTPDTHNTTQTERRLLVYSTIVTVAKPPDGRDQIALNLGQHSWRFEIPLPSHLPPTMNQPTFYPHLHYYLEVAIDRPWYEISKVQKLSFDVYPRVNVLQNPQYSLPFVFEKHNRKQVALHGTLNKAAYVHGEPIGLTLKIQNPQKALIQSIRVLIIQSYILGGKQNDKNLSQLILPNFQDKRDEYMEEQLSLTFAPAPMPPTYEFQGQYDRAVYVAVRYGIIFNVRVQGLSCDFSTMIPFIIGTEASIPINQQATLNDDPPPDYESVMRSSMF